MCLTEREWSGGVGPFDSGQVYMASQPPAPASRMATALAGNLTVTRPTVGGNISLSPATSPLDFSAGQTVANGVTVSLTQDNPDNYRSYLGFTNDGGGTAQLILDIDGYFTD